MLCISWKEQNLGCPKLSLKQSKDWGKEPTKGGHKEKSSLINIMAYQEVSEMNPLLSLFFSSRVEMDKRQA